MNATDAARALAAAAAYDQRTVAREDCQAWAFALADISLDEALAAVVAHYRSTTARIMPGHVHALVKSARRDKAAREQAARQRELPAPERTRNVGELWRRALEAARRDRELRRARVLAVPELAAQLTRPPIGYRTPDQWSGAVPEAPGGRREAILAVVTDAERRYRAGEAS